MEKLSTESGSIKASCHCGAISVRAPSKPTSINECQCTICRRYGGAWAYYNTNDVEITMRNESSVRKYCWGNEAIEYCFCGVCCCVCYWYPKTLPERPEGGFKMGINTRMMDPRDLSTINREINLEVLFFPLNSKEAAHREDLATYCS